MSNRMRPIFAINGPLHRAPKAPPMQNIELIHEASSLVIGPVIKGLSSDNNTGILGELHPNAIPYAIVAKFTKTISFIERQYLP